MTLFGGTTQTPTFGQSSLFNSPAPSGGMMTTTGGFGSPSQPAFGSAPASGFGAPAFGAPATGGFGAPQQQQQQQQQPTGLFGSQPQTTGFGAQPQTGFGAPQPQTGFGAAQPQTGGFGSPSTGFGAGAFGSSTPAFGSAPQTGTAFGVAQPQQQQQQQQQQQPTTGFGAPAQPTLGFGTQQPAATGFGQLGQMPAFGAQQQQQTPTFGAQPAQPTQPATGFGLQPATSSTPTLSFGQQSTTQTSTPTFGFGQQTTTAAPTLGFGQPTSTATPTLGFGQSLGAPAATTSAPSLFGLSKPATTAPTLAKTTSLTTSTPSLTTGTGLLSGTGASLFGSTQAPALATSTPTPAKPPATKSVTFATPLTTTTTASTGFAFGLSTTTTVSTQPTTTTATATVSAPSTAPTTAVSATATTTSSFGSLLGNIGFPAAKTTAATTTIATTTPSLGGLSTPATTSSTVTSLGGKAHTLGGGGSIQTAEKAVKDEAVPNELFALYESYNAFTKEQNALASEVARSNMKQIKKVAEDTENMKKIVANLQCTVEKLKNPIQILKADSVRGFSDCEIAQGNVEDSSAFQADNNAVLEFFSHTTFRFQEQLTALKLEVENTEKHVLCVLNPTAITPKEFSISMQKCHECFVAIGGRLHSSHTAMSSLKQRHLDLRRSRTDDFTNIFDKKDAPSRDKLDLLSHKPSPTPFSGSTDYKYMLQSLLKNCQRSQAPKPFDSLNQPFAIRPEGSASVTSFGGSLNSSGLNFQLKPPPGNKRGKR